MMIDKVERHATSGTGHPPGMSHPKGRRAWPPRVFVYILLFAGVVVFLFPFLWMLATSPKTTQQIAQFPLALWIRHFHFSNYVAALTAFGFWIHLRNSALTTLIPVIGTLLSSSLAGFAFARIRIRGSGIIFLFVLATMLLPGEVTLIPQFVLFRELGMINSLYPLIIPSFFGSPFYIFLMRQFYSRLPRAIEEQARMDGCSYLRMWWSIFLPLSKPALAAVGVLVFIGNWNNFLGPLIYINTSNWQTLPMALAGFQSSHSTNTNLLMAATLVIILPCILLFFFAQKTFTQGLTFTGSQEN